MNKNENAPCRPADAGQSLIENAIATEPGHRSEPPSPLDLLDRSPEACPEVDDGMPPPQASDIGRLASMALSGDAEAQLEVALRLEKGAGCIQNPNLARGFLLQAAGQNLAEAQYQLALRGREPHELSYIDRRDILRRLRKYESDLDRQAWIRRASRNGHPRAQLELAIGILQRRPFGANDMAQVQRLLLKAAEKGQPEAATALSLFFRKGFSDGKSRPFAEYWQQKARQLKARKVKTPVPRPTQA